VPVGSDAVAQSVPAQHTTVKGGNQDNGEESSQGREKEGRQEALSLPGMKGKRGAIVAPFFLVPVPGLDTAHASPIPDPDALNHIPLRELIQQIKPVHDAAENRVLPVQVRLR
jgi:hypothetical protein